MELFIRKSQSNDPVSETAAWRIAITAPQRPTVGLSLATVTPKIYPMMEMGCKKSAKVPDCGDQITQASETHLSGVVPS
jgi:hypothetical protein